MSLYEKAGIKDVKDFYREKFLSTASYRFLEKGQDFRHHLDMAKFHWIFANIPTGSKVLDLGCGCGNLAVLKAKSCQLTGVELSLPNCKRTKENGYDSAICADLKALPFASASFDVVVSLDVLGHIDFADKDTCISEMKRVLKPGGLTLHGIESDRMNYQELSPEKLQEFITVDGHVGMEGQKENEARFKKYFQDVDSQFQFNIPMSRDEIVKQHSQYPQKFQADPFLLNRIKKFNADQDYAWNIAMGFVFERLMHFNPRLKDHWGFLLLRASDHPLPPELFAHPEVNRYLSPLSIGSSQDLYHIIEGFHGAEGDGSLEGSFRWTMAKAKLLVPVAEHYRLCIGASRPEQVGSAIFEVIIPGGETLKIESNQEKMIVDIKGPSTTSPTPPAQAETPNTQSSLVIETRSSIFIPAKLAGENHPSNDNRELGIRLYWLEWA